MVGTVMYISGGQLSGFYMNDIAAFDMKTCKKGEAFHALLFVRCRQSLKLTCSRFY